MATDSLYLDQTGQHWERLKQDIGLKRSQDGIYKLRKGLRRHRKSDTSLQPGLEKRCLIQESNSDIPIIEQVNEDMYIGRVSFRAREYREWRTRSLMHWLNNELSQNLVFIQDQNWL